MAFKLVVLAAALACANAGLISAPVAHYSPATAVSSSYINQAAPAVAYAAAPQVAYAHAAPQLAYAHAAPVAVAHAAPVAIHAPSIGASQQSVIRSYGGNQAISTYSKAVDSAFSSVRKYDTRITNDALRYAAAPVYSTYAAAPVAHAAPQLAYAHAAPVAVAHSAPVYQSAPLAVAHSAPVYAHSAPVAVAHAAPHAVAYSPAAVVSHASFTGLGTSYAW